MIQHPAPHDPGAGIQKDVPRQFRGRRNDARNIRDPEAQPDCRLSNRLAHDNDVSFRPEGNFFGKGIIHCFCTCWDPSRKISNARSTLKAVRVLPSVNPSWVMVMATLGRIPVRTVRPPIMATICVVSVIIRAKNESSDSTAETSRTTPLADDRSIASNTLSWSAETVASSGSEGMVTMRLSRTLIIERVSSVIARLYYRFRCR